MLNAQFEIVVVGDVRNEHFDQDLKGQVPVQQIVRDVGLSKGRPGTADRRDCKDYQKNPACFFSEGQCHGSVSVNQGNLVPGHLGFRWHVQIDFHAERPAALGRDQSDPLGLRRQEFFKEIV